MIDEGSPIVGQLQRAELEAGTKVKSTLIKVSLEERLNLAWRDIQNIISRKELPLSDIDRLGALGQVLWENICIRPLRIEVQKSIGEDTIEKMRSFLRTEYSLIRCGYPVIMIPNALLLETEGRKEMELKHEVKTVFEVDYSDLEEFIRKTYGVTESHYGFIQDQECGNDSSHEFTVEKQKLDSYEQSEIDNWKGGNDTNYMTGTLLLDMCNKGLIEEGTYYISVSW